MSLLKLIEWHQFQLRWNMVYRHSYMLYISKNYPDYVSSKYTYESEYPNYDQDKVYEINKRGRPTQQQYYEQHGVNKPNIFEVPVKMIIAPPQSFFKTNP